jgi:hypothetical protein
MSGSLLRSSTLAFLSHELRKPVAWPTVFAALGFCVFVVYTQFGMFRFVSSLASIDERGAVSLLVAYIGSVSILAGLAALLFPHTNRIATVFVLAFGFFAGGFQLILYSILALYHAFSVVFGWISFGD